MPPIISPLSSVRVKFCANWTVNGTAQITAAVTLNEPYRIEESVLEDIRQALTAPETGGIPDVDSTGTVIKFHHDKTGRTGAHRYIPDGKNFSSVHHLNTILKGDNAYV